MNFLSAEQISKSFNDRWLFKDITLGIAQGEKYALVGTNGVGKSTFLRILTGELEPDSGEVVVREGIRVAYLTQQPDVPANVTVRDLLFDDANEVARVVKEYEDCLLHPDAHADHFADVLERMETLKAWGYEAKVKEVIGKLGVPDLEKPFGELSGGQKKRIFLAQVLLREPDLLLLDEPTNHLDLQAIEWLETFLSGQQITLIMITHDRYFLDAVATEILEIDRGQLFRYRGNYAYFLEKKADREEMKKLEVEKARNLLRKELDWMRRQPKARGTKAKYRIDAFHELKEKASQDLRRDKLELDISEARQGGKILEVEHLTKSYGSLPIVIDFTYTFKKKDRIGIVGANGVGKSTFLNLLTKQLKPDSGEVMPGQTTRFGYFTQEVNNLNPEHRVIEEIKQIAEYITLSDGSQVSASKFLDFFLFPPEKQYNFISKLSGGEKKRLQLLKILVTNPNFLILDEPTNDFDIDTLNVLEDFLLKFSGCLILVSHDRYFMDHLVDQLFVLEGDGIVKMFTGNYSDYRDWVEEQQQEEPQVKEKQPVVKEAPVETTSKQKLSYQEKKEYEALQAEIEKLEGKREEITGFLSGGDASHEQLQTWSSEIGKLNNRIDEMTMRWLELDERAG